MEAYFKAKAKAFIESGVENVRVMTLWDEEYSLLYVTFIDKVNADNNETVVFHEGSNRWITFADLTRNDTWNEFLFPTYEVVDGFPNGLNESFNEEDGFTTFDLSTGANAGAYLTYPTITIEALSPSITSSPSISAELSSLTITPLDVTVVISGLDLTPSGASWLYDEYGAVNAVTISVTNDVGTATITEKPSWLTVKRVSTGDIIGVGDSVSDGETIDIYPTNRNLTEEAKGDYLIVTNSYGDSDSVSVYQDAE
jgi:hypothetical protein